MTRNAEAEIRALVDSFVAELTQHIRTAAVESVQAALLGGAAPARAKSAGPKSTGKKAGKRAPKKTGKGGRRRRRSPEEIEAAKADIVSYVRANPGTAMGDLSSALGEDQAVIRLQLNQLLEEGALRKEGERRGTRYFAGGGGAKKKTKRGKKAKSAKKKSTRKKTARK